MRIGIDVGGTTTDAALLDGRTVLATAKRPTSADVTDGIVAAVGAVLDAHPAAHGALNAIMIGTTHFTNAVIQRRDIASARDEATVRAIAAGGRAETIQMVEVEEIPLAYLPRNALRACVKVVGDLATEG